jgi:hypothetical protein
MKELVLLIEGSIFFNTASHSLIVCLVFSAPVASTTSASLTEGIGLIIVPNCINKATGNDRESPIFIKIGLNRDHKISANLCRICILPWTQWSLACKMRLKYFKN